MIGRSGLGPLRSKAALLASVAALAPLAGHADNPAEVLELTQVEVVGTTLLPTSSGMLVTGWGKGTTNIVAIPLAATGP